MTAAFQHGRTERLPVVPLRDMVVFPHMMAPFIVGREGSVRALERALLAPERQIFLVAQRDPKVDEPGRDDLYDLGVVARVVQNLKLPNGNVKVMVEGLRRSRLLALAGEPAAEAEIESFDTAVPLSDKLELYMTKVLGIFEQYAKMSHHLAFEGLLPTLKLDDADRFADTLCAHLMVTTAEKQSLLELLNPYERLQRLHDLLDIEIEKLNIDKRINVQVKKQMEGPEGVLPQREDQGHPSGAGRKDDRGDSARTRADRRPGCRRPPEGRAEPAARAMPPVSASRAISRNYIDWLISVP